MSESIYMLGGNITGAILAVIWFLLVLDVASCAFSNFVNERGKYADDFRVSRIADVMDTKDEPGITLTIALFMAMIGLLAVLVWPVTIIAGTGTGVALLVRDRKRLNKKIAELGEKK